MRGKIAAEKILRGMMDKVLKRLEEIAKKTKETNPETMKDEKGRTFGSVFPGQRANTIFTTLRIEIH